MKTIRAAVIGCGYWGPNLIRNLYEIPSIDLVSVVDLRQERLDQIRSIYPKVTTSRDYTDLFSMGLDAVVVATPPATHFDISWECLNRGLHVLIEKPMTLNSTQAELLIELARIKDLTLMVGHTFEYNDVVHKLKEIIDSGELGEIYYIDSARLNLGLFQRDLNVLWDLAPHDISILLFLLQTEPISVSAQGMTCVFRGIFDNVYINLNFPNNIMAHIHVSWLDPDKVRRITVVGSKKMVVYDDVQSLEKIRIYDKGVVVPPYTHSYEDFQLSYRYGDILVPYIRFVEPLRKECQHFVDCILNHTTPCSCGLDGLKVVKVLEAAQHSLDNSQGQEQIEWDFPLKYTIKPLKA